MAKYGQCRICTSNDEDALVNRIAGAMWKSRHHTRPVGQLSTRDERDLQNAVSTFSKHGLRKSIASIGFPCGKRGVRQGCLAYCHARRDRNIGSTLINIDL